MVIQWREGLEIGSLQVICISSLSWSYESTERRMGCGGTMGQDQFRNMTKTSVFCKMCKLNAGDTSRDKGPEEKE